MSLAKNARAGPLRLETDSRDLEQQQLDILVAAIYVELEGRCGSPRIEKELRKRGHRTTRKPVVASMVRQGLVARPPRRWRPTTDSLHREPIAPNLLDQNFTADAPDRLWVADTTYLPVIDGFLFLVVILDLFSRKVVGWSLADHLESFFSTPEFEGPRTTTWRTATDAMPEMFTFIEGYYTATRLHSRNGYRSPNEAEWAWRAERLEERVRKRFKCTTNRDYDQPVAAVLCRVLEVSGVLRLGGQTALAARARRREGRPQVERAHGDRSKGKTGLTTR